MHLRSHRSLFSLQRLSPAISLLVFRDLSATFSSILPSIYPIYLKPVGCFQDGSGANLASALSMLTFYEQAKGSEHHDLKDLRR
jgi:hypothetical protein